MPSGDPVVSVERAMPPNADAANPVEIAGASTPAERYPAWIFDDDDAGDTHLDFLCSLRGYDAAGQPGLTVRLRTKPSAATTGNYRLGVAIRALTGLSEDIDTAHTYVYTEATAAAPGTLGHVRYVEIPITHANLDGWTNGDMAVVRVRRESTDTVEDTMSGNLHLFDPELFET